MAEPSAVTKVQGDIALPERRYWAFLSYSHVDKRAATKLHRFLERYRFPKGLVQDAEREQPVPRRFYPVFRDREELQTGDDLNRSLADALHRSRSLIVMCSPASATSKWIPVEIDEYSSLADHGPILFAISPKSPEDFDAVASLPPETVGHGVPLAADCRESGDGFRDAALKLMATVVGVRFDDLKRRDARRRHRRLAAAAALALAIAALLLGLALIALNARNEAQHQESITRSQFLASTARSLDERDTAILVALEAARVAETSEAHAALVDLVLSRDLHAYLRLADGGDVASLAVGPNGLLIGAGERGQIQAWDPLSRVTAWDLTGVHTDDVLELATSPDTSRMVSGDAHGAVVSWTLEPSPQIAAAVGGDGAKITAVAIDDDGVIAFARQDRTVFVRRGDEDVRRIPTHHIAPIDDLLLLSGDSTLVTFGGDGMIAGWDLETMRLDWASSTLGNPQVAADVSTDGSMVASVGLNGTVWDLSDGQLTHAVDVKTINVPTDVVVGAGGSYLVVGDQAGAVSLYDTETGLMSTADDVHAGPTLSVALVPIGSFEYIATSGVGDGAAVQLMDGFPDLGLEVSVGWIDMGTPVGEFIVTAFNDDTTTLESTEIRGETGDAIASDVVTIDGPITVLSGWETSDLFGLVSEGGTGAVWQVAQDTGRLEEVLELPDEVTALAIHPSGSTVAVAHDRTIRVLGIPDLAEDLTIEFDQPFDSVRFTSSGDRLIAVSDPFVVVYDIDDGELVGMEKASPSDVMAANATGSVIAWADVSSRIHVWRPDSGVAPSQHGGHEASVGAMAFSHDGGLLASLGDEGTVRLWEPDSMTLIGGFELPAALVEGATFSQDGDLIVYDYDRTLLRLDLSSESIERTACAIVDRNMDEDEWRRFGDGGRLVQHCEPSASPPDVTIGDVEPDWISVAREPIPSDGSLAASQDGTIRTWAPEGWTLEEQELVAGIESWVRISEDHALFSAEEGTGFEILRFDDKSSENLDLRRLIDGSIERWAPQTCRWMYDGRFSNPSVSGAITILSECNETAPWQVWIAARPAGDEGSVVLVDGAFNETSRANIAQMIDNLVVSG